jgi:hypothetical protein
MRSIDGARDACGAGAMRLLLGGISALTRFGLKRSH